MIHHLNVTKPDLWRAVNIWISFLEGGEATQHLYILIITFDFYSAVSFHMFFLSWYFLTVEIL